jgi:flagellum-specific peptidoglycan hydrolase FlgJ
MYLVHSSGGQKVEFQKTETEDRNYFKVKPEFRYYVKCEF